MAFTPQPGEFTLMGPEIIDPVQADVLEAARVVQHEKEAPDGTDPD